MLSQSSLEHLAKIHEKTFPWNFPTKHKLMESFCQPPSSTPQGFWGTLRRGNDYKKNSKGKRKTPGVQISRYRLARLLGHPASPVRTDHFTTRLPPSKLIQPLPSDKDTHHIIQFFIFFMSPFFMNGKACHAGNCGNVTVNIGWLLSISTFWLNVGGCSQGLAIGLHFWRTLFVIKNWVALFKTN